MNSCAFFERQLWRSDKCKHCFQTESQHSLVRTSSQDVLYHKQQQQQQQHSQQTVSLKSPTSSSSTNNNNNNNTPTKPTKSTIFSSPSGYGYNNNNNNSGTSSSVVSATFIPSVDKAPLSIRRTLTPAAIETFSKRISQSPPTSPPNNANKNKTTPRQSPLRTISSSTLTSSSSSNTTVQVQSPSSKTPTKYATITTPPGAGSPRLESSSGSVAISTPNSKSSTTTTTTTPPLQSTPGSQQQKQQQQQQQVITTIDLNEPDNVSTKPSPSRQRRSHSADTSNNKVIPPVTNTPTRPKGSTMSFFSPSGASTSSPSIPIYQQKHVRDNSFISPSSSPMRFHSHSNLANHHHNNNINVSNNNINNIHSSGGLGAPSPTQSPRLLPSVAKGIIKLRKNTDLKKSANRSLKRRNLAKLTDTNNESFKLFGAIQSILVALPGVNHNAVMSIMDILYNQNLNIDFHTHVNDSCSEGLATAIQTLNTWSEAQDYVRDIITVQSCVRRFLAKRRTQWLAEVYTGSMLRERNIAFRHMIQEERRYIDNLDIMLHYYHRPLKMAGLISDEDFKSIFFSVEEIFTVHQRVLSQFEQLNNKWPCVEGLGDIFLRIAPEFKVYGNYVKNFKNAIDTLDRCRNDNPKFAQFIVDCCDNTPQRVYDLMALIATPLNHLSMYQRQLFVIAQHTPNNWPDHNNINNSVIMMKEIEQLIQDNLAQAQNAATLINIYRKMNNKKALDPWVIPGRIYLHEGKLTKFEMKKQDQVYYYYLCNDVIIFCKKSQRDLLKLKNIFYLSEVVVSDQSDSANYKNIISISKKSGESYFFQVDDNDEKKALLKLFGELCTTTVNKKLFGISLLELAQRESSNVLVPAFIIKTCNAMLNHLSTEGLFRVSPNQHEVDQFKEALNKCSLANMDALFAKHGPHHLAAVFKNFFRDMIPPLLTHELFDTIVEIGDRECDAKEKIPSIRAMLANLPPCNQATMQVLLLLLCCVGQSSDKNKMSYSNLAIVFGPNLVKPAHQTIETSLKIPLINNVITLMLDHYQLIYKVSSTFSEFGWGLRNLKHNSSHSGKYSIALLTERLSGLHFFSNDPNFRFEKYQHISFWVNVGDYTDVPIDIILTKRDQSLSEKSLTLLQAVNEAGHSNLTRIPANKWINVVIPVTRFGKQKYVGLMIKTKEFRPAQVLFDHIELLPSLFFQKSVIGKRDNMLSKCINQIDGDNRANGYFVKMLEPAKPFFTMDRLDHAFYTNQSEFFGSPGSTEWMFIKKMGRIYFYKDGNIRVAGPIVPKILNTSESMPNKGWWVELYFNRVSRPDNPMHIKKELPLSYYTPMGKINTDYWSYYMPVTSKSYFEGMGLNEGLTLPMTGVEMDMPMMVGEGASGKNVETGLSVWMTFNKPAQDKVMMDINVNIVDLPAIKRFVQPEAFCHNGSIAIGLQVFLDRNGDGLKDEEEMGVPGVLLSLTDEDDNQVTDTSGYFVAPIHTDIDGYFYFDKIPYGRYKLNYKYDNPLTISRGMTRSMKTVQTKSVNTNQKYQLIDVYLNNTNIQKVSHNYPVQSCYIIPSYNLNLVMDP
ncbi:hypothetical protein SAMD00019534_014940 [Acytostelium subglobosum LB1]|uniref:hypothetical protein n=1 Tax=Acytostelium subglobosum LB1 TaxID=1410327 RepID=UPI000644BA24|nr:hypothetical protein SAMD00019534_014940 [Acytostelium subglobosum LB1]GAM18319.1 hypothetical protein SAMD00019534_014940 [Acytostelium subglobosum LB1]|eukprot:XP_012757539.1 hypothetical protein SAMD00019534_014940 [Acytostelium subglobosum LB1]